MADIETVLRLPTGLIDIDAFYEERDHRTNLRLSQGIEPAQLTLALHPLWEDSPAGELAFRWLASLIARMGRRYNQFRLSCTSTRADAVLAHLRNADPFGAYAWVDAPPRQDLTIAVGGPVSHAGRQLVVRPDGWSAALLNAEDALEHGPAETARSGNPFGAALAAALGCAAVYHAFNSDGRPDWYTAQAPVRISAWARAVATDATFPDVPEWIGAALPDELSLRRSLVVGAGALGGNAALILGAHSGLRGAVEILDPDVVEVSNLNRLVDAGVADLGVPKVALAARGLAREGLVVVPVVARYEQVADYAERAATFDVVVGGVDKMLSRAAIQADWPPLYLDGGTHSYSWRVSAVPGRAGGGCVGCLVGASQRIFADLGAPMACAVGQADLQRVAEPMDSYPFASFFGATFLAAEWARASMQPEEILQTGTSWTTDAVALNLRYLRHGPLPQSARCFCLCGREVVKKVREELAA